MKKHIITSLLLTIFASKAFSETELKDLVCIVKPIMTEKNKTVFSDYGAQLFREGFMNSGRYMRALANDRSGSGFIVKHGETYYILTNNHVVKFADSVILEFETDTETVEFHSRVLVHNPSLDLALIELPKEKKITHSFTFQNTVPRDGTEVWSAGFPGLLGTPTWQLGKGVISNRSVRNTAFVNSSISFVIQHTAQIDGGNSGGPLLVQNSRSNVGFDVIGINTWKTNHREGTNFAVPAAHITQFLDSIGYIQTAIKNEAKIAERMKAFAAITKSKTTSYKDILPFVSMDYMLSVPAISFMAMMSSASDSARIHAREQFHEIEPFGAFRIIIADAIWRTRSNALTFENTAAAQTPAVINVNFSENGKPVQSEWKYDEGYFSLINFGGLRIKQFRTKASKNYNPDAGAHATVAFPNNDFQTTIYEIGLSRFYNRYIGQGGAFGFNMIDIPAQNEHSEPEKVTNVCIIFNALILQRPIEISKFHIIPYGRVPLAMNLGNALYASVGADFGAKFGMAFKNGNFVYLGLEYRMRFAKYLASEYRGILPERLNSFGITLGYEY